MSNFEINYEAASKLLRNCTIIYMKNGYISYHVWNQIKYIIVVTLTAKEANREAIQKFTVSKKGNGLERYLKNLAWKEDTEGENIDKENSEGL